MDFTAFLKSSLIIHSSDSPSWLVNFKSSFSSLIVWLNNMLIETFGPISSGSTRHIVCLPLSHTMNQSAYCSVFVTTFGCRLFGSIPVPFIFISPDYLWISFCSFGLLKSTKFSINNSIYHIIGISACVNYDLFLLVWSTARCHFGEDLVAFESYIFFVFFM